MSHPAQTKIPTTYMRGGISKGVFFHLQDLPPVAQQPGAARDALLVRVIDSSNSYGKQTDGMGGTTSGTSGTVILSRSMCSNHDVDYLFGQVSIDKPFVDWSGNCGNLSVAVGSFAINNGLINASRIPQDGVAIIRIWQANIGKTVIAYVSIINGAVQRTGGLGLDGVTFPAAEVQLEFLDPTAGEGGDRGGAMFLTGNPVDNLKAPGVGVFKATVINTGIPTVFINAEAIGYTGTELQNAINGDVKALTMFETIRVHGAVRMGPIKNIEEVAMRQHAPRVAFVAPSKDYVALSDRKVSANDVGLLVRASSMGKLHRAVMGTAAAAIGTAAAAPDMLVNLTTGDGERGAVHFGHPSDTLRVGVEAKFVNGKWTVTRVIMGRSTRVLMEGWVRVPDRRLTTHAK